MVEIGKFYDHLTAEMACGRLRAAGIDARVLDGAIASLIGPGVSGVRLVVDAGDEADARALLASLEGPA